jgi:hypothetical protein
MSLLTFVSTNRLSPLFVPVDIVDILLTNVSATPDFFGGGVSHFLRCAAPTLDSRLFLGVEDAARFVQAE